MNEPEQFPGTCGRCGDEAAGIVGEETLCETCYHGASSCCGGDEGGGIRPLSNNPDNSEG